MSAANYDFIIEAGTTHRLKMTYQDPNNVAIDLTGWSARMQLRKKVDDPNLIVSVTSDAATTDANTLITLGGATVGDIEIYMSDSVTTGLSNNKSAVYDLELVDTVGDVIRLIEGVVTISKEVTR